jgi:hypothetical protein
MMMITQYYYTLQATWDNNCQHHPAPNSNKLMHQDQTHAFLHQLECSTTSICKPPTLHFIVLCDDGTTIATSSPPRVTPNTRNARTGSNAAATNTSGCPEKPFALLLLLLLLLLAAPSSGLPSSLPPSSSALLLMWMAC